MTSNYGSSIFLNPTAASLVNPLLLLAWTIHNLIGAEGEQTGFLAIFVVTL